MMLCFAKRLIQLVCLLFILNTCCFCQGISFSHISINDGLSTNFVNCICQDKKGFLWVGTQNGLQRYDGNNFVTINSSNPTKRLPGLPVDQLIYDEKRDVIWVRMGTTVGRFYSGKGEFIKANLSLQYFPGGIILSQISLDSKGHVLFTINSVGVFIYNDKENIFQENSFIIKLPENFSILSVYEDVQHGWYYLCGKEGLRIFDPLKHQSYSPEFNPYHIKELAASKNINYIQYVFIDSKKRFWLKTWPPFGAQVVLLLNDDGRFIYKPIALDENVYSESLGLFENHNIIWCYGTDVLNIYDEDSKTFFKCYKKDANGGVNFNIIQQVFEDKEKNIWVVSDDGLYQAIIVSNYVYSGYTPAFSNSAVTFIATESLNKIILGSWGQGIIGFNYTANNFTIKFDSSFLKKLYKSKRYADDPDFYRAWDLMIDSMRNLMIIGCQSGKTIRYNFKTNVSSFLKPDIFNNSTVRQVVKDNEGNYWYGTQSGKIIKEVNGEYYLINDYNRSYISRLFIDNKGLLWVCTAGFGVQVINTKTNKTIRSFTKEDHKAQSLFSNYALDVVQLNDSVYIISIQNALDVLNIKNNYIKHITTNNGLPGLLQTITKDAHGQVWISTNSGIAKYNPFKNKFYLYNKKDGLISVYSNNDLFNTACTLQNGDIMFAGEKGRFILFNPDSIGNNNKPKDVTITDIRLFNTYLPVDSVLESGGLNLKHDQNTITLNFTSLSYYNENKLTYYYRLHGASDQWVRADKPYSAAYASLSPGTYQFQLKCINADGIASSKITSLNIHIAKPFWLTWWFICLIIIAAFIPVYIIYQLRLKRFEEVQKIREKVARDLHDDVGSTLTSINILSEISKNKVKNDNAEVKDYLNRISNTSSEMMDAMDDIVWNIKPANDTMIKITVRMREYAAAVFEPKNIIYRFANEEKVKTISLNMDVRRSLFLIFKETLNNIAKYANADAVTIEFEFKNAQLYLTIIDNGVGFDEAKVVYGNGIENMQKRAKNFKGNYVIKSYPGKGTHATLIIPLGKYYT